jgi:hypothetical protein
MVDSYTVLQSSVPTLIGLADLALLTSDRDLSGIVEDQVSKGRNFAGAKK